MKPMCLVFGTNLGTEESLVVIHVSVEKLKYEQKGDFHNSLWCVLSQASGSKQCIFYFECCSDLKK